MSSFSHRRNVRGRVTGYATDIGYFAHAVGQTNEEVKALIGSAFAFAGPGFLLPTRHVELFRWYLAHGLRGPSDDTHEP